MKTITLFRPVNQAELSLIEDLEWQAFPSRLRDQPIFFPVMSEQYVREIAEK